jgi:glycosyltransferase involved in cell wall biosynthesis
MPPVFSVVLPCYNEAGNIAAILNRYRPLTTKRSFELILVDNGSTDSSSDVFKKELSLPENSFARMVRVEKNIGYGYGLKKGLQSAAADVLSFSHADLQCPPEDVIRAYEVYSKFKPCLVKGARRGRRALLDRGVTWFYNHLAMLILGLRVRPVEKLTQHRCPDINAEPKMFSRLLLEDLAQAPNDFSFDLFVLEASRKRNWTLYEFDVAYEVRQWGKSKLAANPWVRFKTAFRSFLVILRLRLCRS